MTEFNKLTITPGGTRQAIKRTFRAITQESTLKEKQSLLNKYQDVLDTRLLMRLDTRALKQSYDVQVLERSVQELVKRLEDGHRTIEQLLADHTKTLQNHIDRKFETQAQAAAVKQARDRLLESLFFPEILARHEQVSEAFEGTYEWIFADPRKSNNRRWSSFHDWLMTGDDIYWISGKPGSGKSTLMKFIISQERTLQLLNSWSEGRKVLLISFLFWKAGSALQNSITGFLRSVLYQIAIESPELVELLTERDVSLVGGIQFPQNLHAFATWTDERLLSCLKLFLNQIPSTFDICIFLDGLDEFTGNEEYLLDIIRILGKTSRCKVCVASRPEQAFRQDFRMYPQLRMQDLNDEDIKLTAAGRLGPHLKRFPNSEVDIDTLILNLALKAQGVFLWLDLMTKILNRGIRNKDTYKQLFRKLDQTPDTINGMYRHIWNTLDPLDKEEALGYFGILIVAKELDKSLSLGDLACVEGEPQRRISRFDREYFMGKDFVLDCQHLETRLIACCGGLVEIEGEYYCDAGTSNGTSPVSTELTNSNYENPISAEWTTEVPDDADQEGRKNEGWNENASTKAMIVSGWDRKVQFIHRTASDYIWEQHGTLWHDDHFIRHARIRQIEGTTGRLILSTLDDVKKHSILKDEFSRLMSEITATEYLNGVDKIDETCNLCQTDLTYRAFRSLDQVYRYFHASEQDPFSDLSFLHRLVQPSSLRLLPPIQSIPWCPIDDRLSAAAFFGCRSYVMSRLSTQKLSRELATGLLQCVLSGHEWCMYNLDIEDYYRGIFLRLLLLHDLVHFPIEPNWSYMTSPRAWGFIGHGTVWGALMVQIIHYSQIGETWYYRDKLLDTMASDINADTVQTFLASNADPTTRIVRTIKVEAWGASSYKFVMEISPLALASFVTPTADDSLARVRTSLRLAQAVMKQQILFFQYSVDLYDSNTTYYRLSRHQSSLIEKQLSVEGSTVYVEYCSLDGIGMQILHDIMKNTSDEEKIDEETVWKEIRAQGDAFSCDAEDIPE